MIFKENAPPYSVEIERKQGEEILYINFMNAPFVPSISDDPSIMARVVDALAENPEVARVVFVQQRNYNYPSEQIFLLAEIARAYNFLTKQEIILSVDKLRFYGNVAEIYEEVSLLLTLLRQDPLTCYFKLKKKIQVPDMAGWLSNLWNKDMDKHSVPLCVGFFCPVFPERL